MNRKVISVKSISVMKPEDNSILHFVVWNILCVEEYDDHVAVRFKDGAVMTVDHDEAKSFMEQFRKWSEE